MTESVAANSSARATDRTRAAAGAIALVAVAFAQAPQWLSADTKLDLLVDPGAFLSRALTLWEPLGNFGQLQNQAYGYLLPMGPFFWLGDLLGLPAWVTQRLWWCVVLLTAYTGVLVLARRLGIGTSGSRILAAFAFALSPRASTELGGISVELWPTALAPWLLIPLVGAARGRERQAAARSALVVAAAGGVNAVAVGAMLPLAVIWLVSLPRGRVKQRLMAWWALLVPLAMLWWLGPLILLGRYSPPFLDWIESSAVTTSVASPPNALRGVTHWVGWLGGDLMTWPSGYLIATTPALALLSWAVVVPGLIALGARSLPHRRFLAVSVITGVALTTAGHISGYGPPWALSIQHFLDGAGAPLRNTHKFDVVIRLPLALGLAYAVAAFRLPSSDAVRRARLGWTSHVVRWVAISGVVALAVPALTGQLMSRNPFVEVPPYWREAAQWLSATDDGGRTLVLPGSPFATSTWGDPRDEPLQALASTPWGARSVVPLSSAGNIRLLTAVEDQFATGRPSPGLADYLARAGVSRVLIRADLQLQSGRTPTALTVRSVLAGSTGFTSVARFGPVVGAARFGDTVVSSGLDVAVPVLEVFQVGSSSPGTPKAAALWDASAAVRVSGGTENILTLADAGVLADRPVVLEGDPEAAALSKAPLIVTDGPQRREATFSSVRNVYSQPMTADQNWRQDRAVHDWYPFAESASPAHQVVAEYTGVSSLASSSEASTDRSTWAAFDSDPTTFWLTDPLRAGLPWLQLTLPEPRSLASFLTFLPAPGAVPRQVTVITQAGRAVTELPPLKDPAVVSAAVPSGVTSWLRLEFTGIVASPGQQVGVAELGLPGVQVTRTLRLPQTSVDPTDVILRIDRSGSDACAYLGGRPLCGPSLTRPAAERDLNRRLELSAPAPYTVTAWARPQPGAYLDDSLKPLGEAIVVTASSRRSGEPAERPQAASDGSIGTAWVAGPFDVQPRFTLTWPKPRTVGALQLQTDAALAVSRATEVRVEIGRRSTLVRVGTDGWVRFPPTAANQLTVTVTGIAVLRSLESNGATTTLPFGVSEIVVPGLEPWRRGPDEAAATGTPCGFGPALIVAGQLLPTGVSGTIGDLVHRRPMRVLPCPQRPVSLASGRSSVDLRATFQWQPESLRLTRADSALALAPARMAAPVIRRWDPEQRIVEVPSSASERVLVVHENANVGWRATLGDRTLEPVRIDGWQQGWVVPEGASGEVQLLFGPGRWYRWWLSIGWVALLVVALLAVSWREARARALPWPPVPALFGPTDTTEAALDREAAWASSGDARAEGNVVLVVAASVAAVLAGGPAAGVGLGLGWAAMAAGARFWRALFVVSVGATAAAAATQVSASDHSGWAAWTSAITVFAIGVLAAGLLNPDRRPAARHARGVVQAKQPEELNELDSATDAESVAPLRTTTPHP